MKVQNRLASADILKVIAITAVVFIHGSFLLFSGGATCILGLVFYGINPDGILHF